MTWLNNLRKKGKKKHHSIIRSQIEKVDSLERSTLLNKTDAVRNKDWHTLNINNKFGNTFEATPIIAFRKNKSLKRIIGINAIRYNQKLQKVKQNATKG